jgi:uncharacterized membrane protein (DUF4010 family)
MAFAEGSPCMNTFNLPADVERLMAALAVGLLIGLERGWYERDAKEGGRVAGLRTFALTGLLGGVLGHLLPVFGPWPLVGAEVGLALLLMVSYNRVAEQSGNLSATTAVAQLLTLVLGAFAAHGDVALALAAAVVAAVLLNLKPALHSWLRLIQSSELSASLQLLVLSVVVLPYLPDVGMGPYEALNPYKLWWAIILIAALSLTGHFAMRLSGPQRGILWTGLLGGLASSTAATLALGRFAREQPSMRGACVSAMQAACGVMFLRMAVLLAVISPAAIPTLGMASVAAGVALLAVAVWQWHRAQASCDAADAERAKAVTAMSPFNLGTALAFGAYLAGIAVLVPVAKTWLGTRGLYVLSAVSGLADVDAILVSLAQMHHAGSLITVATGLALGFATLANMASKVAIAWVAAGQKAGLALAAGNLLALGLGGLALWGML